MSEVNEVIKWGAPMFDHHGLLARMAAFKEHVSFGFWNAASVTGTLEKSAEAGGQFGRLTSVKDLPARKTLVAYVRKAAALNESGAVKAAPRKGQKPALATPPALAAALKKNPSAKAQYAAFSPSKRRDYDEWIGEAKTDATRDKRVVQAVEWIAEGKARHWKYQ